MNYIEVKNQFWKLRRSKRITNLQADLYDFLIHESSSRGIGNNWENPFQCANGLVCTAIGISEKSLIDARNVLQQLGLIEFENGVTKQKSPVYLLSDYWNTVSNPVSIGGGNRGGNPVSIPGGNSVYINKEETKLNKKLNETSKSHSTGKPAVKKKSELVFWKSFVEEWNKWYLNQLGESYIFLEKDFAHLKQIYKFLERRSAAKKFEFTEENLLAAFKFFLEKAWNKDEWLKKNFSIPNVLSQFNQIANAKKQQNGKLVGIDTKVSGTINYDGGI